MLTQLVQIQITHELFLMFSPRQIYRYEAERLPPSKVADNCSEGNHVLSHEASYQSFDGAKKFSMSYHKINNGNGNSMNGTRHIAQLHAVPGYTCLIDEVTTSHTTKGNNPVSAVVNDACSNNDIGMGKMEGKDFRKSTTDLPAGGTCQKTSRGGVEFQTKSNRSRSYSGGDLFGACEVGNGTFHSKVPPSSSIPSNLGNNDGNSERSMASKFRSFNFKTDTSEGSANAYSWPYFDEEVDTNSVAATSVAALRKAIEEAQARIKIAKESRERKKTSNRVKLGFDDGLKVEERKEVKIADKVNKSKNKKTRESHEDLDVPLDISPGPGTRKQNVVSQSQVAADFEVLETFSDAKEADGETLGKEFRSSQADHRQEEAEIFEESEQFYEVAKESDELLGKEFRSSQENYKQEESNFSEEEEQFYEVSNAGQHWDTLLEFEDDKNDKKMMHSVDGDEWKDNKTANEVLEKPEQGDEMLKPAGGEGNPEETDKCFERLNTIEMASECEKNGGKLMSGVEVFDQEKNEKRLRIAQAQGETIKKVQESHEKDKCQKEQRERQEPIKDDKIPEILVEDIEHLKRQLISQELVENKNKGEETSKQEELEKELKDFRRVDDTERRIDKASNHEISVERLDFNQREEIEKRFIDENQLEKNKELQEVGENEKIVEVDAYQEEENEKIFKVDAHQKEEEERIFKVDAYVEEENEKIQEETYDWVEAGVIDTKIELSAGNEKIEAALEDLGNQENNVDTADNLRRHDESDILSKHQKPNVNLENEQAVEVSLEIPACEESGSMREVTETLLDPKENVNELELVEVDNDMLEGKTMETDCLLQGFKLSRIMAAIVETIETPFFNKNEMNLGRIDMNFWKKQCDQHAKEFEIDCNSEKYVEDVVPELEKMNEDVEETEVSMHQEDDENDSNCFEEERWVDNEIDIEAAQLSENSEREIENVGLVEEIQASLCTEKNHVIRTETLIIEGAERNVENHQETLASLNAKKNEKKYETLPNQGTKQNEENCQETETGQTTGAHEENQLETLTAEESETSESLQKEVELEKENLRKIDESKEREREKERIAVERAVREARERAFAVAAERAAAEARQRVMAAEARERLGKTSAEANDMSVAGKAFMEAKRKAERAAVERATAEARERALEKALSGKAASETRKQTERYGAERVSDAYRDNGMQHSVSSNVSVLLCCTHTCCSRRFSSGITIHK